MEKARSLLEAESNLDDLEEEPREPAGLHHPSGFIPATATQSGFSPAAGDSPDAGGRPKAPTESGVFTGVQAGASGDRLVDSLQSALGAASRSEAGLGSLQRAIRDASRAFTASRQAQEALTEELRVMHRGLNELMSEKAAVERYAALLTRERDAALDAAEEARREAKREREFLLREQDRFIQLLLEEHEAELQQLRRSLSQQRAAPPPAAEAARSGADVGAAPGVDVGAAPGVDVGAAPGVEAAPVRVQPPAAVEPPAAEERRSTPPGEPVERRSTPPGAGVERRSAPPGELTGAALARYALGTASPAEPERAVPLPGEPGAPGYPSAPGDPGAPGPAGPEPEERLQTYPPAPAVLDLESLAAEVDGNSERPPPIRRVEVSEPVLHLKPARVPTQLYDTLSSPGGESDIDRKG